LVPKKEWELSQFLNQVSIARCKSLRVFSEFTKTMGLFPEMYNSYFPADTAVREKENHKMIHIIVCFIEPPIHHD